MGLTRRSKSLKSWKSGFYTQKCDFLKSRFFEKYRRYSPKSRKIGLFWAKNGTFWAKKSCFWVKLSKIKQCWVKFKQIQAKWGLFFILISFGVKIS